MIYVDHDGQTVEKKSLPEQKSGTVRVVAISDTHTMHAGMHIPKGDVLIHAGDALAQYDFM